MLLLAAAAAATASPGGGMYQKRVWGQLRAPPPGGWGVLWWQELSVLDQIRTLPWHEGTEWVWASRFRPSCMLVKRNTRPKTAVPNHSWIEVSHGSNANHTTTAWFYVAVGSGVWANTGKSAVFDRHSDAARDLLNVTCRDCTHHYLRMFKALADRNYTSVQFLRHCDIAIELVFLGLSGVSACPGGLALQGGADHELPCHCDDSLAHLNCGGRFVQHTCNKKAAFRRLALAGGAVVAAVALVLRYALT